jgi:DNA-binding Lrp family transcriptional regulator
LKITSLDRGNGVRKCCALCSTESIAPGTRGGNLRSAEIDQLDVQLIRELAREPRASHLELARRIGVTRATVHARLAKLVRRGVIAGFGPDLDPRELGYEVQAFVTLGIAQGRLDDVIEVLRAVPQVLEAHGITGSGDVHCRVVARTHEQLQEVLIQINRSPSVVRSNSVIALSELVPYRTLQLLDAPEDPLRTKR